MSFSSNHSNITLDNYEEYFILYLDEELSEKERLEVEAFVALHPHLQPEFELLMGTKLSAEPLVFDKSSLMSGPMKLNTIEEDLLLYIDNELPADKQKKIELELALDDQLHKEYQLLLCTKLEKEEVITCPNKEALYHRGARIRPIFYRASAAAALVLMAFLGTLYFTQTAITPPSDSVMGGTSVTAPAPPSTQGRGDATQAINTPSPLEATAQAEPGKGATGAVIAAAAGQERRNTVSARSKQEQVRMAVTITPVQESSMDVTQPPLERLASTAFESQSSKIDITLPASQKINDRSSVTSALAQRNNDVTAVASLTEEEESGSRKGALKGFFRKATRVLAKTTGIDRAANSDELLIGALAVTVK